MRQIAIDLGGRNSQICVRSSEGEIVEERSCETRHLRAYLRRQEPGRVVLETCAEAFAVADAAMELNHQVRVVPATLVRALGVGARGIKTDERDARLLSEASCRMDLPSVHIPKKQSREWKSVCGMREELVSCRTALINTVRGWLRREAWQVSRGASETFAHRVRKLFRERSADALPRFVERQLETVEHLNKQIAEADEELSTLAEQDETCQRLMTVPGVGPVTALRFVAAIDDRTRFASAHRVESYLGLTPGEDSSSERQRRTGITKAGAPRVRWALTQAAWSARRCRPNDPMVVWSKQVELRRGKRVAVSALCRKLAGILYAIWRDGSTYDAHHGAPKVEQAAG
jgi:transposase